MVLVDTHTHVHFPDFQGDFDQVLDRAQKAGVRFLVNVGTGLESSQKSIELAERFDFVYATVGVHPHDVESATPEDLRRLAGLAKHKKVVAIGEVGLDFYSPPLNKPADPPFYLVEKANLPSSVADRNFSTRETQEKLLIQFFEMAKMTNRALGLHIREAFGEMIALLKTHFTPPIRAVSHCFSGTPEIMQKLVELGLYISFAGPITYKKNDTLREAAKRCPEDRILVETDAPFLAPQAWRGKRNEPAYLSETARTIAELRGVSLDRFSEMTLRNAERLFGVSFSAN